MKKFLLPTMIICIVLFMLAACSDKDATEDSDSNEDSETEDVDSVEENKAESTEGTTKVLVDRKVSMRERHGLGGPK